MSARHSALEHVPRRVSSHDVARQAGVSQATVSRALSGKVRVSAALSRRIAEAATALNYAPNASARVLRSGGDVRLGLVLGEADGPIDRLVATIADGLAGAGVLLVVVHAADGDVTRCAEQLQSVGVDKVMMAPGLLPHLSV